MPTPLRIRHFDRAHQQKLVGIDWSFECRAEICLDPGLVLKRLRGRSWQEITGDFWVERNQQPEHPSWRASGSALLFGR